VGIDNQIIEIESFRSELADPRSCFPRRERVT
jgi:hypothetical protein